MPTDPDYLGLDLTKHLVMVGMTQGSLKHAKKEAKSIEEFRHAMHGLYVVGRDIWFENFKEGFSVLSKSFSANL